MIAWFRSTPRNMIRTASFTSMIFMGDISNISFMLEFTTTDFSSRGV